MKILFLARRFYPDIGGVEKHILVISEILISKGHDVTVLTQTPGENTKYKGINIIRFPRTKSKKEIWSWVIKNRYLFKTHDIIHAHDVFFWYFPLKLIFPFKKAYVTFHGYESYPILKRAIIMRKISELLSNGNIIVGEFIRKWYGTKPDYVIYGGVEIPSKTQSAKFKNSALFFGRLDEQTGILEYAKAVDEIKKRHPEFKFKIVGEGKFSNKLKRYKPVKFKTDLTNEYSKYNFVFVSRYLSVLEALAQNREVFAIYDNPVKRDYLYMTPFKKMINIASNKEELIDQLESKINDKSVINYRSKIHNYSWESVVNTYLKLWKI